jgi:DNA-nicking Smr family endonuclease
VECYRKGISVQGIGGGCGENTCAVILVTRPLQGRYRFMSRSKKKSGSTPPPFNNPFRSGLRSMRKKIREARVMFPKLGTADRDSVVASCEDPAGDVGPVTDSELFQSAMVGARSLKADGGRRIAKQTSAPVEPFRVRVEEHFDPTSEEHFDLRFSDRYVRGRSQDVRPETMDKLARGEFAVRSHVDLHGMAFDHAREAVDGFIAQCRAKGERCVLIITGKGRNSPGQIGVLREGIPEWLARGPSARCVLAFVTARPCDGGEGALYVLLRRHASRKARIDVESGSGK